MLGELTIEQRKVENLKKKHRIGDWNLGQKRALFEYDKDQYDKERMQILKKWHYKKKKYKDKWMMLVK